MPEINQTKKCLLQQKMVKFNTNFIPFTPDANTDAYLVGGTVRDILLKIPPKDCDIVTFNDPETLARKVAASVRGRLVVLGKPGRRTFRIVTAGMHFDIAAGCGGDIEQDLAKRDFTVNAMAVPLHGKTAAPEVIDPCRGLRDLENRTVRMISPDNFQADPLRLLRAFRIAAMRDFTISPETTRAIQNLAPLIRKSAGERVHDELMALFATPRSGDFLLLMDKTGLLTEIFPELAPLKACAQNTYHQYDAFEHTIRAFQYMEKLLHWPDIFDPAIIDLKKILPPEKDFSLLKYTILLHDIGKPAVRSVDASGRIHFYTHEAKSADMAAAINHRLRLSGKHQQIIDAVIRHHLRPLSLFNAFRQDRLTRKAAARFFLKCHPLTREVLVHATADFYGKGVHQTTREFAAFLSHMIRLYQEAFSPGKTRPPLITGKDLIREFDLRPSPLFSTLLSRLAVEQYAGNLSSREEALAWVKNFLKSA